MERLKPFLVTFRSGNYEVIQARSISAAFRVASDFAGSDLCDVQQIPDTPEDWHEQDEQFLHTIG